MYDDFAWKWTWMIPLGDIQTYRFKIFQNMSSLQKDNKGLGYYFMIMKTECRSLSPSPTKCANKLS